MCLGDPAEFAIQHRLTPRQARLLLCTAEHLLARKDGGTAARLNIVAACIHCNQLRHRRKKDLSAEAYREHVARRIAHGHWHNAMLAGLTRH